MSVLRLRWNSAQRKVPPATAASLLEWLNLFYESTENQLIFNRYQLYFQMKIWNVILSTYLSTCIEEYHESIFSKNIGISFQLRKSEKTGLPRLQVVKERMNRENIKLFQFDLL